MADEAQEIVRLQVAMRDAYSTIAKLQARIGRLRSALAAVYALKYDRAVLNIIRDTDSELGAMVEPYPTEDK
jgi:hypothetical protein